MPELVFALKACAFGSLAPPAACCEGFDELVDLDTVDACPGINDRSDDFTHPDWRPAVSDQ